MKKNKTLLLSGPYIAWMVIFTLIPLGVVAYYALTDPATGVFTFDNLKDLGMYLPVLGQSILYSLAAALVCLVLGYPVAYYIAHCKPLTQKILYNAQRNFLFHQSGGECMPRGVHVDMLDLASL